MPEHLLAWEREGREGVCIGGEGSAYRRGRGECVKGRGEGVCIGGEGSAYRRGRGSV